MEVHFKFLRGEVFQGLSFQKESNKLNSWSFQRAERGVPHQMTFHGIGTEFFWNNIALDISIHCNLSGSSHTKNVAIVGKNKQTNKQKTSLKFNTGRVWYTIGTSMRSESVVSTVLQIKLLHGC